MQIKMRYVIIFMYLLFKTLYMSKPVTKDEDLIILSEDTEVTDTLEELTLDLPESSADNEIISFWEEEVTLELDESSDVSPVEEEIVLSLDDEIAVTEDVTTEKATEERVETEEVASDFSFDLTTEETSLETTDENAEAANETTDVDFGGFDLTADDSEVSASDNALTETVVATAGVSSMNSILEETVAKLEARKEAIAGEKSGKTSKVADLKAEIAKLEEEVLSLEAEIEWLDEEASKITANIDGLQDMKLWNEDAVKEHNSNRMKK